MIKILFAVLVLGVLGLGFGLILTFAEKKFRVNVDERIAKVRSCLGGANCGACGYAGCDNFVGSPVDGYRTNRVVGTAELAAALLAARNLAQAKGLQLKKYQRKSKELI